MTQQEIYENIISKREKIESLINPEVFVFNPEIARLEKEISVLQEMCQHKYENGYCINCGMEEK